MDVALFTQEGLIMILRWVHFFAGIAWIGHLYYFNFVQGAFLTEVDASVKTATMAKLAPRALWWFRWGAMGTFLSGVAMLAIVGKDLAGDFFYTPYGVYIYTGALLGTLMFLNVWLIIWPRQKIIVASALSVLNGGQANPEAAKLGPGSTLASRTNVLFSIPLFFFMGASRHLSLNMSEGYSPTCVITAVTAVILLLQVNAMKGKTGPMTSVKGVIHCGLALLVLLYGLIEICA